MPTLVAMEDEHGVDTMTNLSTTARTLLCGLSFYGIAQVAVAVNEMSEDERNAAKEWLSSYASGTWQHRTFNYIATNYGL